MLYVMGWSAICRGCRALIYGDGVAGVAFLELWFGDCCFLIFVILFIWLDDTPSCDFWCHVVRPFIIRFVSTI